MGISKKFIHIVKLLFNNWQNKAISIVIAILIFISFYFNKIKSITIEKEFNIILDDRITLGKNPEFDKIKVIIKVNKEDLKYINFDKISLFVDASNIKNPGKYKLPIRIKNLNSISIAEYKLSRTNVLLDLDNKISKTVKVEPKFKLIEKDGKGEYFLAKYKILPELLKIYGPEQELKKITTIQTKTKEFDTRTIFASGYLEIIPPSSLVILEKDHVVIHIFLTKKHINKTIKPAKIIFNNLKDGLIIKNKEEVLNPENEMLIKIKTKLTEKEIQDHLNNENINFMLDLSEVINPGTYNINMNIILRTSINETEIYDYEPKKITVEIIEKEE